MATPTFNQIPAENPSVPLPVPEAAQPLPEHPDIQKNLERQREKSQEVKREAREKAETKDRTRERLEEVKPQPAAAPETRPVQPEASSESQPEKIVEKKFWDPATWTPEERLRAKNIATFAGTGAVVIGGLLLAKWLWGKTKTAAGAVKEKIGKGWSWLKFGLVASGLTIAGYLGIQSLRNAKETMDKLRTVTDKIRQLEKGAKNLTGEAKAAAEAEIDRLKKEVKNIRSGTADESLPDESPAEPKKSSPGEAHEVAETIEATASDIIISKAILATCDDEKWMAVKETKERQLQGVMLLNADIKMPAVFAHIAEEGSGEGIFQTSDTDLESRKKSANVLLRFCAESRDAVVQYLMRHNALTQDAAEQKIDTDMPLKDYLRAAIAGSAVALEAIRILSESEEGAVEALQKLDIDNLTQGSALLHDELNEFISDNMNGLGLDQQTPVNTGAILKAIIGLKNGTVSDHIKDLEQTPPTNLENKIIQKILQELRDGNTHLYVLPCFHDIFPTDEGGTDEERVKNYILARMSPAQAVRLYLYRRLMDKGYSTGLVMMQLDTLKFLAEQDESWFNDKKHQVIMRIGKKMIGSSGKKLAEEWKRLGIDIDCQEMFETSAKSIGMIGAGVMYGFGKIAQEQIGFAWALYKEEAAMTTLGLVAGGKSLQWAAGISITDEAVESGLKEWDSVVSKTDPFHRAQNTGRTMLMRINPTDIANAHQRYRAILHAINDLPADDPTLGPVRAQLKGLLDVCIKAPRNAALWRQLSSVLSAHGLKNAADAAALFEKTSTLRRVVDAQRYAHMRGGPLGLKSVGRYYLRAYEKVESGASLTIHTLRNSRFLQEALRQTGTKIDDLIVLLSKIRIPPQLAKMFASSSGGMTMLLNAMKSGGSAGVEYLVKLGSIAMRMGPILGKAAVGIDVVVCAVEIALNRVRIAETNNVSLKDLYASRDKVSAAQATAGTAMGAAWLATGWAPVGATISASTFAPAVIALIATKHAYDQLEAVSETWLSEESDWAKKSPAELRVELKKLAPGEHSYWQGAAGGTRTENWYRWMTSSTEEFNKWEEQVFDTIEDANTGTRYKITRAYVAKMTDLPKSENESDAAYGERFTRFQMDQIAFLGDQSQGSFPLESGDSYRNAHAHAELLALSRAMKAQNASQIIMIERMDERGNPIQKEFDLATYANFTDTRTPNENGILPLYVIHAYQRQRRAMTLLQTAALKEMDDTKNDTKNMQDFTLQHSMLRELKHDIVLFEERVRAADLEGLDWTGKENTSRTIVRYMMNVELRKLLRAESDRLRAMMEPSIEEMEHSIEKLRALVQQPPEALFRLKEQYFHTDFSEFDGKSEVLTDISWITEQLYLLPSSAHTPSMER